MGRIYHLILNGCVHSVPACTLMRVLVWLTLCFVGVAGGRMSCTHAFARDHCIVIKIVLAIY